MEFINFIKKGKSHKQDYGTENGLVEEKPMSIKS